MADPRTLPRAVGGFEAGSLHVNFDHLADHQNPDASFARGSPLVLNPDSGRRGDVFAIVEHQDYESSRIPLAWRSAVLRAGRLSSCTVNTVGADLMSCRSAKVASSSGRALRWVEILAEKIQVH